jgi:integrase
MATAKPPKRVTKFSDRGMVRYRHRAKGQPTRYFKSDPFTPEWWQEYAVFEGTAAPRGRRFTEGTLDDLCERYYRSQDFNSQGETSRAKNRAVIESFREGRGSRLVAQLTFEHLDAIFAKAAKKRDGENGRKVGGPAAAERLRKQLRRLFTHAVRVGLIRSNPVELTAPVKYRSSGFHTWTEEEIAQYQERHPLGTKARLALEVILWTGQRRGDAHRFGPKHIKGDRIRYEQEKKDGKPVSLPLAPQLRAAIAAMPAVGMTTFLVTEAGKPFSKAGFGNWFRDRCNDAGLPHCAAHGLRKAIARRLAEAGASQRQIKAVGDWTNDRQVATYTADADQVQLAEEAFVRLVAKHSQGDDD